MQDYMYNSLCPLLSAIYCSLYDERKRGAMREIAEGGCVYAAAQWQGTICLIGHRRPSIRSLSFCTRCEVLDDPK